MKEIIINGRAIGDGHPTYLIAEMSANHSGSLERAKEIIRRAKEAGADCVKIQTYTPDTLTIDCNNQYFQVNNGTWEGENLYGLYGKAFTPWEWQAELFQEARRVGIDFFSTPFDKTSVDFLESIGITFYKIASFEMIDLPLLRYVASKGKPIILSTGMGTLEEIKEAVTAINDTGNDQVALLKCCSSYPAVSDQMNLRTIPDMKERFQMPIGLSDHSMGYVGAVAAVAIGANIIEKHFCISRSINNPDSSFSMEPDEYARMVENIRATETALGSVSYGASSGEESSKVFRRSIFVVQDIREGETFTNDNLRIIRPGYGEKPKYLPDILGMSAGISLSRGTPFSFEQVKQGGILFLTNNPESLSLCQWLADEEAKNGIPVWSIENKISLSMIQKMKPSFIISYNYRHIIPSEVLDEMNGKAINLHVSLLPYNRGSSPNFFSFIDNTPKGVTIHQLSAGLDRGDIYCQQELFLDETKESFASSYQKLQEAVSELFRNNWEEIRNGTLPPKPQVGSGSYHTMKELQSFREAHPFSWDDNIADMKRKYGYAEWRL
jgi:pseudaminic acid synthase